MNYLRSQLRLVKLPSLAEVEAEMLRRRAGLEKATIKEMQLRCSRLSDFVAEAWHILEPTNEYVHGWHIDAICQHLEWITYGKFLRLKLQNRLLTNVPPGTMKSLITSVFWPAWEWGPKNMPHLRYIATSYSDSFTKRDSRKMRDLVTSDWYQMHWPLRMTRVGETSFENEFRGSREAVPFGSLTGGRGDRVIIDDPHSTETAESPTERERTTRIFKESVPSRMVDPKKSAIVVIMQRLHEGDISGVIKSMKLPYIHLNLPMEYEADNPCSTVTGFVDPRTVDGELLFPERFPREVVERDKSVMGAYATAGQFQQRPSPRGGGLFQKGWFSVVPAIPAGYIVWVRGWDLAATKKSSNPKAAFTAGVKLGKMTNGTYIVADVTRGQLSPLGAETLIVNTASQDGYEVIIDIPQDPGQSGKGQVRYYVTQLAGYTVHYSPETGSKEQRADPVSSQAEVGNIVLLKGDWNDAFLEEFSMFPSGTFKDQVDAMSRAFSRLMKETRASGGSVPSGPRIVRSDA